MKVEKGSKFKRLRHRTPKTLPKLTIFFCPQVHKTPEAVSKGKTGLGWLRRADDGRVRKHQLDPKSRKPGEGPGWYKKKKYNKKSKTKKKTT